ncbi:SAC3/GANP/Nin1/mts3/eIF-3 p25 family-domain-containing protein [Jimgerdemannia flammicorona]|uniref:SAC3/GANP/Nin1/mts3/eIF-3 p25 family-domain-containing protein n=1 Tax=Jimgerdemannia flammicorona TaxID=994334 RepID=A0A433QMM0_9FUNG|nr:SAC3/GANP/Nin1/mts3/eIF-3 p25 family-domain-containing protein [Jimgerdemannia flammicorona]
MNRGRPQQRRGNPAASTTEFAARGGPAALLGRSAYQHPNRSGGQLRGRGTRGATRGGYTTGRGGTGRGGAGSGGNGGESLGGRGGGMGPRGSMHKQWVRNEKTRRLDSVSGQLGTEEEEDYYSGEGVSAADDGYADDLNEYNVMTDQSKDKGKAGAAASIVPPTAQDRLDRFTKSPHQNRYNQGGLALHQILFPSLPAQLKALRQTEREEAIAQGKIADPNKQMRLEEAVTFVGECQDMCPEFEREEREFQNGVDRLERVRGCKLIVWPDWSLDRYVVSPFPKIEGTTKIDPAKAVKAYHRPAAGNEQALPSDVRPPPVLKRTLDYLFNYIVGNGFTTLEETHGFVWDRTRSVRQDFTLQNIRNEDAIEAHEKIARYHILCLHFLSESKGFEVQQEQEQLSKVLQSLTEFYDDLHMVGTITPNEPEFRAYYIVNHLRDQDIIRQAQLLPLSVFRDPWVQRALEFHSLAQRNNEIAASASRRNKPPNCEAAQNFYSRFFKRVADPSTPYLLACMLETHFPDVRKGALKAMNKSYLANYKGYPLAKLVQVLGFDDEDEAMMNLSYYGLDVTEVADTTVVLFGIKDERSRRIFIGECVVRDLVFLVDHDTVAYVILTCFDARSSTEPLSNPPHRKSMRLVEPKRANLSNLDILYASKTHSSTRTKSILPARKPASGSTYLTMSRSRPSLSSAPPLGTPSPTMGTQGIGRPSSQTQSQSPQNLGWPSAPSGPATSPVARPGLFTPGQSLRPLSPSPAAGSSAMRQFMAPPQPPPLQIPPPTQQPTFTGQSAVSPTFTFDLSKIKDIPPQRVGSMSSKPPPPPGPMPEVCTISSGSQGKPSFSTQLGLVPSFRPPQPAVPLQVRPLISPAPPSAATSMSRSLSAPGSASSASGQASLFLFKATPSLHTPPPPALIPTPPPPPKYTDRILHEIIDALVNDEIQAQLTLVLGRTRAELEAARRRRYALVSRAAESMLMEDLVGEVAAEVAGDVFGDVVCEDMHKRHVFYRWARILKERQNLREAYRRKKEQYRLNAMGVGVATPIRGMKSQAKVLTGVNGVKGRGGVIGMEDMRIKMEAVTVEEEEDWEESRDERLVRAMDQATQAHKLWHTQLEFANRLRPIVEPRFNRVGQEERLRWRVLISVSSAANGFLVEWFGTKFAMRKEEDGSFAVVDRGRKLDLAVQLVDEHWTGMNEESTNVGGVVYQLSALETETVLDDAAIAEYWNAERARFDDLISRLRSTADGTPHTFPVLFLYWPSAFVKTEEITGQIPEQLGLSMLIKRGTVVAFKTLAMDKVENLDENLLAELEWLASNTVITVKREKTVEFDDAVHDVGRVYETVIQRVMKLSPSLDEASRNGHEQAVFLITAVFNAGLDFLAALAVQEGDAAQITKMFDRYKMPPLQIMPTGYGRDVMGTFRQTYRAYLDNLPVDGNYEAHQLMVTDINYSFANGSST